MAHTPRAAVRCAARRRSRESTSSAAPLGSTSLRISSGRARDHSHWIAPAVTECSMAAAQERWRPHHHEPHLGFPTRSFIAERKGLAWTDHEDASRSELEGCATYGYLERLFSARHDVTDEGRAVLQSFGIAKRLCWDPHDEGCALVGFESFAHLARRPRAHWRVDRFPISLRGGDITHLLCSTRKGPTRR